MNNTLGDDEIGEIVKFATAETEKMGFECGKNLHGRKGKSLHRLAHAIEHLAVIDLVQRKASMPTKQPEIFARTVQAEKLTGFWFKKGITSSEEEMVSVKNALEKINSTILQ